MIFTDSARDPAHFLPGIAARARAIARDPARALAIAHDLLPLADARRHR